MNIKTITCHDVYNPGASLQAYALMTFLEKQGHEVEIIDYKPDYLSHHYDLWYVSNPKYRNFLLKYPYLLAKLPQRLKDLRSQRKNDYDEFTEKYLKRTSKYQSFQELVQTPPQAELFLAGSDQIWNTFFQNGYDPAFYLQFVKAPAVKASYAASFAVEEKDYTYDPTIQKWLSQLDRIAVREPSALEILKGYGLQGVQVMDPVFLLSKEEWKNQCLPFHHDKYICVIDFDQSDLMKKTAKELAVRYGAKILSLVPIGYEDDTVKENQGPLGFLSAIARAECIVSNSFHATAFSILFHKDFYVVNRIEKINSRMKDLLAMFGLSKRLVVNTLEDDTIDWQSVDQLLETYRTSSIQYLNEVIELAEIQRGDQV